MPVATKLLIAQVGSGYASGSGCATPFIISAVDNTNALDTSYTSNVFSYDKVCTVTVNSGSFTQTGPTVVRFAGGQATFYRHALVGAAGNATLAFATSGLTGITSGTVAVGAQTGTFDQTAELPRSVPSAAYPSPVVDYSTVSDLAALATALSACAAIMDGVHRRIKLSNGIDVTGNALLPARTAGSTGIIIVEATTVPTAIGVRATAGSFTTQPIVRTATTTPAFRTVSTDGSTPPSSNYRLVGLNLTCTNTAAGTAIVSLGADSVGGQTAVAGIPTGLTVDRCFLHGDGSTLVSKGLALHCITGVCVDSTIKDIITQGAESQGILTQNGPGPYLVQNNDVESATENWLFASGPDIVGVVPSDITVRLNKFTKPTSWGPHLYEVKNIIDTKNCARVLFDSNIFENNWGDQQDGIAINIKSNDQFGTRPDSGSSDITFKNNTVRNSGGFLGLNGAPEGLCVNLSRVSVHDNAWYNYNTATFYTSGGATARIAGGYSFDLAVEHNTFALGSGSAGGTLNLNDDVSRSLRSVWRNNVCSAQTGNNFGVFGSTGTGTVQINICLPSGVFAGNLMGGCTVGDASYPAGNHSLPNYNDVGMLDPIAAEATWDTADPVAIIPRLALGPSSSYLTYATDGTAPGIASAALVTALTGVWLGVYGAVILPAASGTSAALTLTLPVPSAKYSQQDQQQTRRQIEQAFAKLASRQAAPPVTGAKAGNVALTNLLTAIGAFVKDATS